MSARSYLYVPADQRHKLDKAPGLGADALICDLEDGVAPSAKQSARDTLAAWLASGPYGCEVWVRVNAWPVGADDLRSAVAPGVTGVMLAKAGGSDDLAALDEALTLAEADAGMEAGCVRVVPLLETASAVLDARVIASGPRVSHLAIGEADLGAELNVDAAHELWTARGLVVLASAASGVEPPTAPISTDFRDLAALRASTVALKQAGFGARSAIHPAQVPVINEVFTPSAEEVASARRLVELYDAALAEGSGVITDDAGRMVDEAVVRIARRVAARGA